MAEPDWIGSCDVGVANLALSFLDPSTRIVRKLLLINMTMRGTEKLELGPANFGRVVHFWVKKLAEYFARCRTFAIELQPQRVGRAEMHIVQAHIESCVRCLYPHVDVLLTDPKKVRRFFDISGGAYKERKNKSVASGVVAEEDLKRMRRLFKKSTYSKKTRSWSTKTKIDDVVEASLIALYVAEAAPEPIPIKVALSGLDEPAMFLMENVPLRAPPRPPEPEAWEGEEEPKKKRKRAPAEKPAPKKRKKAGA